MALNLRAALHEYGIPALEAEIAEAERSGEVRYMTEETAARISHDAVVGNFLRRATDEALTGEWIV